MNLNSFIRDIPDFPKKGIVFKDITTLLNNKDSFNYLLNILKNRLLIHNVDQIVGIESRGFIFGAALAALLKCGFVPIRKFIIRSSIFVWMHQFFVFKIT